MRPVSENAEVQRLLGVTGQLGSHLGPDEAWAYHIIRLVGNYADSWHRHFAPMGLERGLNATWQNGGLHAALPFN